MLQVGVSQGLGSPLGLVVPVTQPCRPRIRDRFAIRETELCASVLGLLAVDVRSTVFDVEDEPDFDAGVGYGDFYAHSTRLVDGVLDVRVLVTIEHTPDLVEVARRRAPLVIVSGMSNQRTWVKATGTEVDPDLAPFHELQVLRFGHLSLRVNADYPPRLLVGDTSSSRPLRPLGATYHQSVTGCVSAALHRCIVACASGTMKRGGVELGDGAVASAQIAPGDGLAFPCAEVGQRIEGR